MITVLDDLSSYVRFVKPSWHITNKKHIFWSM